MANNTTKPFYFRWFELFEVYNADLKPSGKGHTFICLIVEGIFRKLGVDDEISVLRILKNFKE